MKRIALHLTKYWFAEAPAARLSVLRILVGAFVLLLLVPRLSMLAQIGRQSSELFAPVGIAAFLRSPLPPLLFDAILAATVAANVAFLLGWRYRISGPAFAVLLTCVLCYRNSWSMIYHSHTVLLLHVVVLGLAPSADALSLDARRRSTPAAPELAGWQYGWPIRLMCALVVAAYFVTGVAKICSELGLAWATGESLRSQVAADALRKEVLGSSPSPFAALLFPHKWLFSIMGAGALVLELGAPLALLNRRVAWVWAVLTFLMHWGIFGVMAIDFRYHLSGLIFAPFFPVERLAAAVTRALAWVRRKGQHWRKR